MGQLGNKIKGFFQSPKQETLEDLEELLIASDIGAVTTREIIDELHTRSHPQYQTIEDILRSHVREVPFFLDRKRLNIVLLVGVNGAGKTTAAAKLAFHLRAKYHVSNILLAACDTYRAAAIEQLDVHAARLDLRIVKQERGSDPAAVLYDSIQSARARKMALVIADTAGRMQTRAALMEELKKIESVAGKLGGDCLTRTLLVIDASTGQNALHQAEIFHDMVGIDSVLLSKYDVGARGGVLIPIAERFGLGCSFLGTGESYEDLEIFQSLPFVRRLLET